MRQPMLTAATGVSMILLAAGPSVAQNRLPSGGDYYADDHYRDGRYYPQRRLGHRDRIYRGRDGRYYCRRSDGTTGLIVGAGIGALLGNAIDPGRSRVLGTLPGAGVGGVLSLQIDSGTVRCR